MKTVFASTLIAVAATISTPAIAASNHDSHASMPDHAAAAAMTDGLVKKVDKPGGKLTVSHGPLPNGMPAMTMVFRVKDAVWLDQLKNGDRIRFAADTADDVMTIVRLVVLK